MKKEKFYATMSDAELLSCVTRTSKLYCLEKIAENGGLYDLNKNTNLIAASLEMAKRYLYENVKRGDALTSPLQTRQFLQLKYADQKAEVFSVLFMDNRNRVIAFEDMFSGTIDGCSVYPREVVRSALKHNAAAVIFSHNHPSGVAEPSRADEQITKRLKEALALVDIRVLDHMVVGDEVISFAERGLL